MYFDFEDGHPDIVPVGRAISWREGVLFSFVFHLVVGVLLAALPFLPDPEAATQQRDLLMARRAQERSQRFIFVQPRLDVETPQPRNDADASDKDRVARTPERAPDLRNALPFARGNTSDRVEGAPDRRDRANEPGPESEAGRNPANGRPDTEGEVASASPDRARLPEMSEGALRMPDLTGKATTPQGGLGRALRNLQRYIERESFDNVQGGGTSLGPFQFDTKGVEFGPWIRRFVAQIKRNWFIPYAAMSLKGHVVLTFNVHKDGTITDIQLVAPSDIDAFNHSAFNALAASNPTQPLPSEYPADKAFFTVTFYYNETPQ